MKTYNLLIVITGRNSVDSHMLAHDSIEEAEDVHNAAVKELQGNGTFGWGVFRMYPEPTAQPETSVEVVVNGKRMVPQLEEKHQ